MKICMSTEHAHTMHNTRKILYRSKHDTLTHVHTDTHTHTWTPISSPFEQQQQRNEKRTEEKQKNAETENEIFNPRLSTFPHLDNR